MSFTDKVKAELCAERAKKPCCRRSLLYGILALRARVEQGEGVRVALDSELLFALVPPLVGEQLHRECRRLPRKGTVSSEELVFSSPAAAEWVRALSSFSHERPFPEKCPHCRRYFLAGMFLGAGRVSDPAKEYHLEFSCGPRRAYAAAVLSFFGLSPKVADRRREALLYFRDSSSIEDLFAHMGATQAAFALMDSKIERDMRNDANRIANCDANNIGKVIAASGRQIELIERLIAQNKISFLPPELEATARLRLAHQDLSIAQLAAISDPPMTKSGLNHRLKKLTELAKGLLEEKKEGG